MRKSRCRRPGSKAGIHTPRQSLRPYTCVRADRPAQTVRPFGEPGAHVDRPAFRGPGRVRVDRPAFREHGRVRRPSGLSATWARAHRPSDLSATQPRARRPSGQRARQAHRAHSAHRSRRPCRMPPRGPSRDSARRPSAHPRRFHLPHSASPSTAKRMQKVPPARPGRRWPAELHII